MFEFQYFDSLQSVTSIPNPFLSNPYFRLNYNAKRIVQLGEQQVDVTILQNGRYQIDGKEVIVSDVECTKTSQTQRPIVTFGIMVDGKRWNCKAVQLSSEIAVNPDCLVLAIFSNNFRFLVRNIENGISQRNSRKHSMQMICSPQLETGMLVHQCRESSRIC
jgi:hypothetical protein